MEKKEGNTVIMNVFSELIHSVYDLKSYRLFLKDKKRKTFLFGFLLVLIYFLVTIMLPFVQFQISTGGIMNIAKKLVPDFKIADGRLDMELVLRKFVSYYQDIFGELQEKFLEDNGRCLFLLYIKPIINGTGNYYIEAKTRTNRRTDLIIDYCGEQHIVELKLWRGQEYNKRGEEQLTDYLDLYHAKQGYLVSFNFNKKKKVGVERLRIKDKIIFEAVV